MRSTPPCQPPFFRVVCRDTKCVRSAGNCRPLFQRRSATRRIVQPQLRRRAAVFFAARKLAPMKILVVGNGGREHALAWKIAQSPRADRVFVAPGNAGTAADAENVDIPATDVTRLVQFARDNAIDLTIVGPEAALTAGLVDALGDAGLRAFGPSKAAAELEGSKVFCKESAAPRRRADRRLPRVPISQGGDHLFEGPRRYAGRRESRRPGRRQGRDRLRQPRAGARSGRPHCRQGKNSARPAISS